VVRKTSASRIWSLAAATRSRQRAMGSPSSRLESPLGSLRWGTRRCCWVIMVFLLVVTAGFVRPYCFLSMLAAATRENRAAAHATAAGATPASAVRRSGASLTVASPGSPFYNYLYPRLTYVLRLARSHAMRLAPTSPVVRFGRSLHVRAELPQLAGERTLDAVGLRAPVEPDGVELDEPAVMDENPMLRR